jgi:hypothetical protein
MPACSTNNPHRKPFSDKHPCISDRLLAFLCTLYRARCTRFRQPAVLPGKSHPRPTTTLISRTSFCNIFAYLQQYTPCAAISPRIICTRRHSPSLATAAHPLVRQPAETPAAIYRYLFNKAYPQRSIPPSLLRSFLCFSLRYAFLLSFLPFADVISNGRGGRCSVLKPYCC